MATAIPKALPLPKHYHATDSIAHKEVNIMETLKLNWVLFNNNKKKEKKVTKVFTYKNCMLFIAARID